MDEIIKQRRSIRRQRSILPPEQKRRNAIAATRLLICHPWYRTSRRIACYWSSSEELSTQWILQHALYARKHCYLPLIQSICDYSQLSGKLIFRRYTAKTSLENGRFGIPVPRHGHDLIPAGLNLVIVPLVAFDMQGGRIGMGGGFYDRAFAFRNRYPRNAPRLLGFAHQFQQVTNIPLRSWDVPLDGVVTEKQVIIFPSTKRKPENVRSPQPPSCDPSEFPASDKNR